MLELELKNNRTLEALETFTDGDKQMQNIPISTRD